VDVTFRSQSVQNICGYAFRKTVAYRFVSQCTRNNIVMIQNMS